MYCKFLNHLNLDDFLNICEGFKKEWSNNP